MLTAANQMVPKQVPAHQAKPHAQGERGTHSQPVKGSTLISCSEGQEQGQATMGSTDFNCDFTPTGCLNCTLDSQIMELLIFIKPEFYVLQNPVGPAEKTLIPKHHLLLLLSSLTSALCLNHSLSPLWEHLFLNQNQRPSA